MTDHQESQPGGQRFVAPPPDWLNASPPVAGQVTPSVPDWLNASGSAGAGVSSPMPDWLAKIAQAGSAGMAAPPLPSAPPPMPAADLEPEEPPAPAMESAPEPPSEPEGLAAAPSEAPAPSAEPELPDFLSTPAADSGATPLPDSADLFAPSADADIPDWMKDSAPAPTEPGQPAASEDVPDWMKDSAPAPAEPSQPVASSDVPEWLRDSPLPAPESTSEPSAEGLDWLMGGELPPPHEAKPEPAEGAAPLEPEPAAEPAKPAEPAAPAADVPDWLNALASSEAPAEPAPALTSEPAKPAEPAAPAAPAADVPDWLNALASSEAPAEPAPAPAPEQAKPAEPAAPAADVPDWLNALASSEAPAAPAPAPTPKPAQPAEPAAPPEPAADVPDWLNALASSEAPAEPAPAPAPEQAKPAEPAAPAMASEPSAAPSAGDDLLDWMAGVDFNREAPASAVAGEGEDLLGLTGDLVAPAPAETADTGVEAAVAGELPEWLRGLKPTGEGQAPAPMPRMPSDMSADELREISDLRFERILGETSRDAQPPAAEKVGALKDVTGAIRPELVFDAHTLRSGRLAGESALTKEQERRILLLESLLAKQSEEVVIAGGRRGALPVARWLIALLLIAAIASPLALGIAPLSVPAAPSGGVSDAKRTMDSLPADAIVLVAFEYEPDTAAEMEPLAGALLKPLAERGDVSVIAVSVKPLGPSMADRVFKRARPTGDAAKQWVNLGFLPGGSVGISSLVSGGQPSSPFAVDFVGQPTGIEAATLAELSPSVIVVVASNAEDLRAWVEQAARPTGIPTVAAVSASSAPLAMPYRQSSQLAALMSGVNDAVAYRAATGQKADPALVSIWNAQALGALAAAAMIVAGGVIYGLIALREQQEQNA